MVMRLLVMVLLVAFAQRVMGADYCVSNASELNAALTASRVSTDATATIRVQSGDYAGSFVYATTVAGQLTPAIVITGGWLPDCSSLGGARPHISGALTFTGTNYPHYSIAVDALSVDGEVFTSIFGLVSITGSQINGGGIEVGCCTTGLTFERNLVIGSSAKFDTTWNPAYVWATQGTHSIRGNAFAGLSSFNIVDQTSSGSLSITSNTMLFTQTFPVLEVSMLNEGCPVTFGRNLIQHDTGSWPQIGQVNMRLDADGNHLSSAAYMFDNWLSAVQSNLTGDSPASFAGNGNVVTPFALPFNEASAPYDLHLRAGSSMIDYSPPSSADLTAVDLDGNPRVSDGAVDVGAYERQGLFRNGFEL